MAQTDYKSIELGGPDFYAVDDSQAFKLGLIAQGYSATYGSAEFIYLKGVASVAEGSAVLYDEVFASSLLAANDVGPVAIAMAAVVANKYGWFQISGKAAVKVAAASADNGFLGREGADGQLGDGFAAGDQLTAAVARSATDTPTTGMCWAQIGRPWAMNTA